MFGADGLPLGLLSAPSRFQEISFWFSPDLWVGRRGIKSLRKNCGILLILFTCTMLALFSGPSSAVLMIPQWTSNWHGGGAVFHMIRDSQTLWPDELTIAMECSSEPYQDNLQAISGLINNTCPSSSTAAIAQALQGSDFDYGKYEIDFTDGLVRRKTSVVGPRETRNIETWATTPMLAPCIVSRLLSDVWVYTAIQSSMTDHAFSSYRNYKYRDRQQSRVTMVSQVPIVRTSCFMHEFGRDFVEPIESMVSLPGGEDFDLGMNV